MGNHAERNGWVVAWVVLALFAVAWAIFSLSNPRPLDERQVQALGHAVDVSIALCVGFLTLDRFRTHRKVSDLAGAILKDIPKSKLLERFERDLANSDEMAFITLLYFAGDDDVAATLATRSVEPLTRTDFFRSWRGWSLDWLLRARVDRKVVILVLVTLCAWQFAAAVLELRPAWANFLRARSAWGVLGLASCGFLLPGMAWIWAERTLDSIKQSTVTWKESHARAIQAAVAELEPIAASSAPRRRGGQA